MFPQTDDSWICFRKQRKRSKSADPQECEFRHEIKEMWVNFARTGNPSSETVPPSASANETGFTEQFCDSVGFERKSQRNQLLLEISPVSVL